MKENLLSIIIPVYNCEKYIGRCIESVIRQTYTNLEIILVDDGSNDKSLSICEEYAEKDSRIKVIHKSNGGVSSARNCGIKACTGDYIGFIDSDDYIDETMYEELLNALLRNNTQISMCRYYNVSGEQKTISKLIADTETISNEHFLLDIFNYNCMGVLWNKLFKRQLFFKNDSLILFREDIHLCEDVLILTMLAKYSTDIAVCSKPLYNYVVSTDSLCHGNFNERKLTVIQALDLIVEQCRSDFPSILNAANYFSVTFKIQVLLSLYDDAENNHSKQINDIKKRLRSQYKNSDSKTKLRIILAVYFPSLYKKLKGKK